MTYMTQTDAYSLDANKVDSALQMVQLALNTDSNMRDFGKCNEWQLLGRLVLRDEDAIYNR